MESVEALARAILAREGGYVADPDDPGGPTNRGITLATLRRLGRDLNRDGRIDTRDLRQLSADQAVAIFIEDYYRAPGIDRLPAPLRPSVFDMYVNAGAHAVGLLQRLVVRMGFECSADGVIGPQTIGATQAAQRVAPRHLVDAYGIVRRNYYYALADARPASRKYARTPDGTKGGWIRRAEEFIAPHYHLSAAEHRERIASWG